MEEPWRIVLLGKTGSGKSRLGNTIFGIDGSSVDQFTVSHSSISGTKSCMSITREVEGRNIKLIDTPGIFDTDPDSADLSPELLKCIIECAPGPHAFLLVLKVERYTQQEQAMVDVVLKYFSEEALKYTTVVFTHGDELPDDTKIEDWITENTALKNLIKKCGGRCHVFDSRRWNNSQDEYRNNQAQIKNLLNTIEETVKENGGECYSNEMLQVISDKKICVKLAGVATGVLLGALLGVPVTLACVFYYIKAPPRPLLVAGAVTGALVGGAVGGWRGYEAAKQADTPREAAEAVLQEIKELLKKMYPKQKYSKLDSDTHGFINAASSWNK